ncbi:SDR family NAD(P)-dependent oxidoreductase [Kitasatospora sp. NPDC058046]|uniref:SDR family NAD(P)-dependent oxidoreductase n=1 Tax=Kitasatospora sp. NPDC058046 TaxID=3346312 RepID=UPI0036DE101C
MSDNSAGLPAESRAADGGARESSPSLGAVAIIGVGMRLPGGINDLDSLWATLEDGRDVVGRIPADRFDASRFSSGGLLRPGGTYTSEGGFMGDLAGFDADFFGISPREAAVLDPQQRLVLECSIEALDDAGVDRAGLAGSDTAVVMGASALDWGQLQQLRPARFNAYTMSGHLASAIANRVSYVLDLRGPSMTLDTACSSGLTALHQACESLRSGRSGLALAGGVNVLIAPGAFVGFSQATMLSPTGQCHPFSAKADGYVRSEGAGVLLLKPLATALADGDRVHAVIAATHVNSDGRTAGLSLPDADAQAELLEQVYRQAGVEPSQVSYVEAHGTGTQAGDPVECRSLGRVLGARRHGVPLPVGSVKSNLGHLEAAAGMAGVLKAILVLRERRIPRTLHGTPPNPAIDFVGLGLEPATSARSLPAPQTGGDVVGVNSFGFGGANAHAVLRTPPAELVDPWQKHLEAAALLVSARTPRALDEALERWAARLDALPDQDLHAAAWTSRRRTRHLHRAAVIAPDTARAAAALRSLAEGTRTGASAPGPAAVRAAAVPKGGIVFVCAGNASQWAGMGRELLVTARSSAFRSEVEAVSALMAPTLGWSVRDELAEPGQERDWDRTEVAQPVLFALQAGLIAELAARGVNPSAVVGYSVGEVAAAYCAGALDREAACRLIVARSQAQAATAGLGRMAAVGLGEADARRWLARCGAPGAPVIAGINSARDVTLTGLARCGAPGALEIAGINSARDVTLTGEAAALAELGGRLRAEGTAFRDLGLEYAFHSAAMEAAEPEFHHGLAALDSRATRVPMISTVTGAEVDGRSLDPAYWWRNIREPVRFAAAAEAAMATEECGVMLEIGPRPVLRTYLHRVAGARPVAVVPTLTRTEPAPAALDTAMAHLMACGARFDEKAAFPRRGRVISLPAYPWQRERHWNGSPDWWTEGGDGDDEPGEATAVPLCGRRSPGPVPVWHRRLDPDRVPWLTGLRLGPDTVLSALAHIDLALASGRQVHGTSVALEAVVIGMPLALPAGKPRAWPWLAVTVESTGTFRVESRTSQDGDWTERSHGRITPLLRAQPPPVDLAALRARLPVTVDPSDLYRRLERCGLHYDRSFRTLEDIRTGRDELLVRYHATTSSEDPGHVVHPTFLDAALQAAAPALRDRPAPDDAPYLPVAMDQVRCWKALPAEGLARLRLVESTPRRTAWDLTVMDASGQILLEITGCRMHRQEEAAPVPVLTEVHQAAPLRGKRSEPDLLPPPPVPAAAAGTKPADAERRRCRAPDQRAARSRTLALAAHHTAAAIRELLPSQSWFTIDDLLAAGVDAKHRRQLTLLLDEATRHGLLVCHDAARWRPNAAPDPRAALAEALDTTPQDATCLLVHAVIGRRVAGLLTGRADAQDLLFGEADQLAERYYDTHLPTAHQHRYAASALGRAVGGWPADRPLRVLEVGAGTGCLTSVLLPHLPPEQTHYTYTDISPAFFPTARRRFRDHGFIEYRRLDLNADPADQGFAPHSFDLIAASNALHPAADLRATLRRLSRLLTDGGQLLAVEHHDLALIAPVFGFLDSFWDATDRDLRPDGPLLSREQWLRLLPECGFADTILLDDGDDHSATTSAFLAVARAPHPAPPASRAPHAETDGRPVVLVDFGSSLLPLARATLRARTEPASDSPAHWARIIAQAAELVLLSGPSGTNDATATTETAVSRLTALGALAAACRALPRGRAPRIHLAAVEEAASGLPIATGVGAALWGALRVLANEQPGLAVRRIVLTPDALGRLATEIHSDSDEDEVVLTAHGRFVPRLRPWRPRPRTRPTSAYRLVQEGTSYHFDWRACPIPAPGSSEVLVEVAAAALNYRDVMAATGLVPLASPEGEPRLGCECAGTVTAVGRDVTTVAVGARVACMATGSLASHVLASAAELTILPDRVDFADAATLPVVTVTVDHSLDRVARLQSGETVLVHGAAGGVGLAAVRHARHIGARIIATAGTPAKRDLLHELGLPDVFDSRNPDFADRVLDATEGEGVDVVLNSLTGEAMLRGLALLKPRGRFVELGRRDFLADRALPSGVFERNASFHGVDILDFTEDLRSGYARELASRLKQGGLTALPHRRYAATRIDEAFAALRHSRHLGKIVITFDEAPPVVPEIAPLRLDPTAEYLITGGHSGFGAATARHLAVHGARHLILVGRRGRATPEAPALLADLRRQGVRVTSHAADAADPSALREVLADLDARGRRLAGVVHSAMVLHSAPTEQLTARQTHAVLAPKLTAALLLDEFTRERNLDLFLVHSSAAVALGNRTEAAYAAAGTAVEALVAARRKAGLPGLAIQWGPLSDVGYVHDQGLAADLEAVGLTTMTAAYALGALDRVLERADHEDVVLCVARLRPAPLQLYLPTVTAPRTAELLSGERQESVALRALSSDDEATAGERTEEALAAMVADVLETTPDRIDRGAPLVSLGLDSLMATELSIGISQRLGIDLSAAMLLAAADLRSLAEHAGNQLDPERNGE